MSRRTMRGMLVLGCGVLGLVWVWAAGRAAAPRETSKTELAARGKVTYRIYCANCHGAEAKGDGRLAPLLKVAVPDLTQIAARNGGTFDAEVVRKRIDGRDPMVAHGSGEMPIWGLSFQNPDRLEDQEDEVAARLDQLVAFLETIQQK